jgi:hypothetical protein
VLAYAPEKLVLYPGRNGGVRISGHLWDRGFGEPLFQGEVYPGNDMENVGICRGIHAVLLVGEVVERAGVPNSLTSYLHRSRSSGLLKLPLGNATHNS